MLLIDYSDYIDRRAKDFTERKWIFEAIDDWVASAKRPGFFTLTGNPGSGKTAIAARLCQLSQGTVQVDYLKHLRPGFLSAFHFCAAKRPRWISPFAFTDSLATQLANRYPDYLKLLFRKHEAQRLKDRNIYINAEQNIQRMEGGQVTGVAIQIKGAAPEDAFLFYVCEPLEILFKQGSIKQLFILIDALDEALAYRGETGIVDLITQTGFPSPGVHFIVLTRPIDGLLDQLGDEGVHERSLSSDAGLIYSHDDVKRHVLRVLDEDQALAGKLDPDLTGDAFAAAVQRKSQGNFLYVKHLMLMLAAQQEPINRQSIEEFPAGLNNLYIKFLQRLVKRGWATKYAPVIGTLAVAQEALTEKQVADFVGKKQPVVRAILKEFLQFLDVNNSLPADQRTYPIYHQSFAEFLLDGNQAENYWCEKKEQHGRIVRFFFKAWGGLNKRLSGLQEADKRRMDDGYGLRHLTGHLEAAEQFDELHSLLALEDHAGRNVWYEAKEAEGQTGAYSRDIQRAWKIVADLKSTANSEQVAESIGLRLRYALIASSMRSLSSKLPPELLAALVEHQVWEPERALEHVLQTPDPEQQMKAIEALAPLVFRSAGPQLMSAVLGIPDDNFRGQAIASVGHYLFEINAEQFLEALEKIEPHRQGWVLAQLAPRVPENQLDNICRMADKLNYGTYGEPRGAAASALARRRAVLGDLKQACQDARRIRHPHWRLMALLGMVEYLPENRRPRAALKLFRKVLEGEDFIFRADEMMEVAALSRYLPDEERDEALEKARAGALNLQSSDTKVRRLLDLLRHLHEEKRLGALREAKDEIDRWDSLLSRRDPGEALKELAICYHRFGGLSMAREMLSRTSEFYRIELLAKLFPRLSPAEQDEVRPELRAALKTSDSDPTPAVRARLVAHLPPEEREQALRTILTEVRKIGDVAERAGVLAALAPSLAKAKDMKRARRATQLLRELDDPDDRDILYEMLAVKYAEAGNLGDAFKTVRMIKNGSIWLYRALLDIAHHLTVPFMEPALAEFGRLTGSMGSSNVLRALVLRWVQLGKPERALALVQMFLDKEAALSDLISNLKEPAPTELLLEVLSEVQNVWPDSSRERLLVKLLPHLIKAGQLERAREEAKTLKGDVRQTAAQLSFALHLPKEERLSALEELVRTTNSIQSIHSRIEGWLALAGHLPAPQKAELLQRAQDAALALDDKQSSIDLLLRLEEALPPEAQPAVQRKILQVVMAFNSLTTWKDIVTRLSTPLLYQAIKMVEPIENDHTHDEYLTATLPRLAALGHTSDALRLAVNMGRQDWRGKALASIARYLDPAQLQEAFAAAGRIYNDEAQAEALAGLIPYLDEKLLPEVLAMTQKFKLAHIKTVLKSLASRMDGPARASLVEVALRGLATRTRQELLGGIAALIPGIERMAGIRAVAELDQAVWDVGRWWP